MSDRQGVTPRPAPHSSVTLGRTLRLSETWFLTLSNGVRMVLSWDFPGGPLAKTLLSTAGVWVHFLVREVRPHMLCGVAKIKKYIYSALLVS